MQPTDTLKAEHRVIEQVLDCLERMVERIQAGEAFERDDARGALAFFRAFADTCHHGKEEDLLFPAMIAAGIPSEVGPVAVMLAEHDQGRSAIGAMDAALEAGDDAEFAGAATTYLGLLRDHIAKEDNILFPLADSVLREREAELAGGFDRVEAEVAKEKLEQLAVADRLAASYDVTLAAERSVRPFHGCG